MIQEYDIYNRVRISLHLKVTLLSPLSHIGEVQGNVSNLKVAKRLDLEGNPRAFFLYSGNALRNGILRRKGITKALEALGLQINRDVHHTLFCGGRLEGGAEKNMELDTKVRKLMPWLSVLGTAKPVGVFGTNKSQMIPGRLNCGSAYLLCYETADLIYEEFPGILPPEVASRLKEFLSVRSRLSSNPFEVSDSDTIAQYEEAKAYHLPYLRKHLKTWTEYLTHDQTTRRDSTHDPELIKFLPDATPALKGEGEDKKKPEKSQQMISSDMLIMGGATLYSRWDLFATPVEIGWIVDTLFHFAESPYLGGKNNRGNGLVRLDFWYKQGKDQGHFLSVSNATQQISEEAQSAHKAYKDYLSSYQEFLAEAKESQAIRGLFNGD